MAVLTLAIDIIFHNPIVFHTAITILTVSLFILAILYGLKNCRESEIKHFTKYIIFSLFQIMFWAFYMLTPIALMQFIEHNVQRKIFNITLASQWLPNIDSIVILAFSPMLIVAIKKIKLFNEPANYYSLGFLCLSLGLASMASGLHFSVGGEKIALWIALFYLILITFGEIFISPISDSFIGEFITESMRGIITGTSKINICIGVLFSSLLANKFVLPYTNKGGLTLQGSVHLEQFFIITSCAILALMLLIPLILGDNRPKGKRFFVKNKEIIEGKV
jgi:POT family proton-dependent oligopeptide transporter